MVTVDSGVPLGYDPADPVTEATLLMDLPVTVLDTETTGLDVTRDRIVSIGTVRLHGGRIYRSATFDRLVRPGIPIPPRSTARSQFR